MKKHILLGTALSSLLMLGACDYNEDNFSGYDELEKITNVQSDTLDLVAADYKKIAGLKANEGLALSKDPEGETYLTALKQLEKDGFFTEMITPLEFLPAYLEDVYPYVTDNSKYIINYRMAENLPGYLAAIAAAKEFDLDSENYKTVWGENKVVKYLTPSTVKEIPNLLKEGVKSPKTGDVMQVNYAYSETEPSIGGGEGEPEEPVDPTYTPLSEIMAQKSGNFTSKGEVVGASATSLLISDGTGIVRILRNTLPTFAVGDVVEVSGDVEFKQELTRFRSASTVKFLERKADFAYPTPKPIDDAYFAAYVTAPKVEYVSYEGKLTQSGTNYNIVIGDATIQPGLTNTLYVNPDLVGKDVVVTGYLTGVSGSSTKYPNTFVTSVTAKGTANTTTPVGVLQYIDDGNYEAEGVVTAIYTRGFMLSDCSGSILVYKNKVPEEKVGQIVRVKGTTSVRNGVKQFGNKDLAVTVLIKEPTDIPEKMVPQVFTAAEFDALAVTPRVVYATIEGQLSIEDSGKGFNYFNLLVAGASTSLSISYVDEDKFDMSLNGKTVKITGFLLDYYNGRVAMMYSKVEGTAATVRAITRASEVEPNASALYRYNGSAWAVYNEESSAGIVVMQPSDYVAVGSSSLSKPNEVLPVYLKNSFPYAQAGDIKTVAYRYNTSVAADEYTYDGTAWVKTVNSVPGTIVFMMANGKWIEAVEYYFNDLDGLLHGGAHIVDVDIPESLKEKGVWRATEGFNTILGSAHDGSKGCKAESWLVMGEIDLSKAVSPKIMVTAKCKYLPSGKTMTDFVNVYISSVYKEGDKIVKEEKNVKDWVKLEFPEWPVNDSYVDMETMVPSEFLGKKVYVGFQYVGVDGGVPNIQMKNFVVKE